MIPIVTQLHQVPQVRQVSEGSQDSQGTEDTQVRQVPRYTIRCSTLQESISRYTVGIIYEVPTQVRPNRWQQSPWTLVKSTQRSNALRARSSRQKLLQEFPKSFALEPKVKTVTEKLRFIHHLCIGNLIIAFHWVSQLELFFHNAIFTTFSYKRRTDFRFQLLQSTRQRKPEVALEFAFDRCEGKDFTEVKRKIQCNFRFSLPRTL